MTRNWLPRWLDMAGHVNSTFRPLRSGALPSPQGFAEELWDRRAVNTARNTGRCGARVLLRCRGGVEEEQVDESSQAIEECGTFRRTCDVYVCACEASEVTVLFCKYQYPAPPKGVVGRKLHGEGGLQATPLVEEKYLGGMPRLQKHTCEILDGVLKVTASSEIHARFTPESLTSTQSPTHHYWSLWWKSAFA